MAKQKKIIERNLPLTNSYKVLSIQRQSTETAETVLICDNCNAEIINFADIQDQNGKRFNVGLDCMETLTKALVNLPDYEFQKYAFNSALRFYALLSKAEKVTFRRGFVTVIYTDKKGNRKEKSEMEGVLTQYNFNLDKFRRELSEREKLIEQTISDFDAGKPFNFTDSNGSKMRIVPHDGKNYLYKIMDGEKQLYRLLDIGQVEKYIERYTEA